jgi:HSP20 family protein
VSISSDPFEDIERLFKQMSRQFDEASRAWESGESMTAWPGRTMSVDVVDEGDSFEVAIDTPGFDEDDIDVRIHGQTLQVDASRETTEAEESKEFIRQERRRENLHREVKLPATVDTTGVSASMQNGVLSISIPKAEGAEGEHIEIA